MDLASIEINVCAIEIFGWFLFFFLVWFGFEDLADDEIYIFFSSHIRSIQRSILRWCQLFLMWCKVCNAAGMM